MKREPIEKALSATGIQSDIRGDAIEPCLRISHAWQFGLRRVGVQKGLLHEVFGKRTVAGHAVEIVQ